MPHTSPQPEDQGLGDERGHVFVRGPGKKDNVRVERSQSACEEMLYPNPRRGSADVSVHFWYLSYL